MKVEELSVDPPYKVETVNLPVPTLLGKINVILVSDALNLPLAKAVPLNETEFNPKKLDPLIVIVVPTCPLEAENEVITGRGTIWVLKTFVSPDNPELSGTNSAAM